MLEATAVNTIEFTCLVSCHSKSGDALFDGDGCWGNCKSWAFCHKDISSGIGSFLERLITHLSWIHEEVEGVTAVLKVLVVLEAILEVIVEALEMRSLHFLIWVFLYCRDVFSLLLKFMFCRFVKAGSSSFCCKDVLVLAISVWSWLVLMLVHLILLWMSEHSAFFIMAC